MITQLIEDGERFAALRTEWTELLNDSAADSPFLSWPWVNAWWTHLGGRRKLSIVVVRDRDRLLGVLPLAVVRRRLAFSRWELLGTGFVGSDYLDAIVRRGFENEVLRALTQLVRERNIAVHLDHLPPGSVLAKLAPAMTEFGWSIRGLSHGVCPYIPLTGHTWDSFLATLGAAHRATTRRRFRLLDRQFSMRFERISDAAMRHAALTRLFDFHDARFGARGTAFPTPASRSFHRDVTDRLEREGYLRLYGLSLNGELAGVMYGLAFKDRFYFYQHGYDPRLRSHGIGRAVLDLSIKAAIDEGLAEFDLLYGDEAYKFAWTAHSRVLERLELFPARWTGRIHQRTAEAERVLRALARRVFFTHAPQTN